MMNWIKEKIYILIYCMAGEPTSNQTIGDKIKIGRRGSIGFFITAKGIQGHTASVKELKMLGNIILQNY